MGKSIIKRVVHQFGRPVCITTTTMQLDRQGVTVDDLRTMLTNTKLVGSVQLSQGKLRTVTRTQRPATESEIAADQRRRAREVATERKNLARDIKRCDQNIALYRAQLARSARRITRLQAFQVKLQAKLAKLTTV